MKRNYFVFAITLLGMYHTTCGQEVHTIFNLKNQMVTYDTLTTERANAQRLTLKLQQACDSLGLEIDSWLRLHKSVQRILQHLVANTTISSKSQK